MQYIKGIEAYKDTSRSAVTLGKFDGLHRGHQKLVSQIQYYKKTEKVKSVVFTFDMASECIMTNEERRVHLDGMVDYLVECPFSDHIKHMEAEAFIRDILVGTFHIKYVVVGTDFHFGHDKRGNYKMLQLYAETYGYQVDVLDKECYNGRAISSTYIKEELRKGNIQTVNELLGYAYLIVGTVEHGKKLGRQIGFPTMNVLPLSKKILPPDGVYMNEIKLNGRWYKGIGNIGVKPTVPGVHSRGIESFLLEYEGDAYGEEICIRLLAFKRAEKKFDSVSDLQEQLRQDIENARQYFCLHQE